MNNSGTISERNMTLLVGVGNEYRKDDAVGIYAVRILKTRIPSGIATCELHYDLSGLLDVWAAYESVYVIDAVSSGSDAGTIHEIEVDENRFSEDEFSFSSHTISLSSIIGLSRAINQFPKNLVLYGIEGKDFSYGCTMSNVVKEAADRLVESLEERLRMKILQIEGEV
jgi:hydrogenase maturation protease